MPYDLLGLYLKLPVFGMVLARLGGMLMFQPLLAGLVIPPTIRALLIVGLAALVTPFVEVTGETADTFGGMTLALGAQLLLGGLMGLAVRMCFIGLQMGGLLIAQESGLAFGQIADPTTGARQSVLSSFYLQVAAMIYLSVGGHRVLVAASLDSFRNMPLLGGTETITLGAQLLLDALAVGGELAVRVAAPVVLTLFLVNVAMGFISRTVPQLNIATVGFSLKSLVAFSIMAVSLPSAVTAFTEALGEIMGYLHEFLGS